MNSRVFEEYFEDLCQQVHNTYFNKDNEVTGASMGAEASEISIGKEVMGAIKKKKDVSGVIFVMDNAQYL